MTSIQAYYLGLRPLFWPSARFEGFFGLREALRPLSGQKIPQNGPQAKTKSLGPNNKPGSHRFAAKKTTVLGRVSKILYESEKLHILPITENRSTINWSWGWGCWGWGDT